MFLARRPISAPRRSSQNPHAIHQNSARHRCVIRPKVTRHPSPKIALHLPQPPVVRHPHAPNHRRLQPIIPPPPSRDSVRLRGFFSFCSSQDSMDLIRAGGFTSFFQDPDAMPTFTNSSSQPPPFSPYPGFPFAHAPFPLFCTQPPSQPPVTAMASGAGSSRSGPTLRVTATPEAVDDGRGRMYYTQEEDLRMVSAWLNNSTDPIAGNARKGETYWSKVAETYNATTLVDRKREMHHLKGHWHKTTKKVSFFNGCYIQLRDSYASGRSDDQLMEQALELLGLVKGIPSHTSIGGGLWQSHLSGMFMSQVVDQALRSTPQI